MPEGDSIFRAAAMLRGALADRTLRFAWLRDRGPMSRWIGRKVQAVDSLGKHLLVTIEPDAVLRVHLGMHGRWRLHPPEQAFPAPGPQLSVVLATENATAVCRRAMQVELVRAGDPRLRERLAQLGPDLLAETIDWTAVLTRARSADPRAIAETLLDQRVAAGIGNVYKSEVLFLAGVHPFTPTANLDDATLLRIYERARELMRANLGPGPRTTTTLRSPGMRRPVSTSRAWVYRRHGLPCLRCRTPIERALQGDMARSTYWCPRCQPDGAAGSKRAVTGM